MPCNKNPFNKENQNYGNLIKMSVNQSLFLFSSSSASHAVAADDYDDEIIWPRNIDIHKLRLK